jgi:hypothetical protein
MHDRIAKLRRDHAGDPVAMEIADRADREIDIFNRFSDHYSYGFFVVRPEWSSAA